VDGGPPSFLFELTTIWIRPKDRLPRHLPHVRLLRPAPHHRRTWASGSFKIPQRI